MANEETVRVVSEFDHDLHLPPVKIRHRGPNGEKFIDPETDQWLPLGSSRIDQVLGPIKAEAPVITLKPGANQVLKQHWDLVKNNKVVKSYLAGVGERGTKKHPVANPKLTSIKVEASAPASTPTSSDEDEGE